MNKIAILTLNGCFNYGNRLQNFALQEVLTSLGFETETVIISHLQAHLFAWMSLSISNWSPSIRTLGTLKKPRLVANVACMGI